MTRNQYKEIIEKAMDALDVPGVVELMAEIAREKAEHVESNWQESGSTWGKAAEYLDKVQNHKAIQDLYA